ncbi:MAG: hypothetical protein LLG05_18790 [Porphyromonadaceae bacterium]|nr:hypothetical protein [Porphyromonadaceae bacterium]
MRTYGTREIFNKIIGNVRPVGEIYEDETRLENLKELNELLNYAISEMYAISKLSENPEYSARKAGSIAVGDLRKLKEWLNKKHEI